METEENSLVDKMKRRRECVLTDRLQKRYPFITKGKKESQVLCRVCDSVFSIATDGNSGIKRHIGRLKHKRAVAVLKTAIKAEISQDSIQVAPKTETDSSAKKRKKTTETATDKNKNGQISDHNEKYYQTPYRSQKLSKHYCIDNQKLNNNIRDCSTAFGEYIASKHRRYNDHVRSVIEHSISQILFDADMGNYNSPMRQTTGNDSPMVNHFENVTLNESKDETSDLYHVSKSSPYHTSTESDDNNDDSRINHANRLSTEDDTIISNVE